MTALRIRLFGGLQLWRGDDPLPAFATQRARALFAYLTLNRTRPHAREQLIGRLWGDEPESVARKALRMALWRVRSVVDPQGQPDQGPLRISASAVAFNQDSPYWLDVDEFEHLLARVKQSPDAPIDETDARHLQAAIDLYDGDLLEEMYDDWCLYDRERLRLLYHGALERLMHYEQSRGGWDAAIGLGQRLLALDPLMEQIHRELMLCYLLQGSRASALRQFEICSRILHRELDVEPMTETIDLYHHIRDGSENARPLDHHAGLLLERVEATLNLLYRLTGHLEETRQQLAPSLASRASDRDLLPRQIFAEAPPGRF